MILFTTLKNTLSSQGIIEIFTISLHIINQIYIRISNENIRTSNEKHTRTPANCLINILGFLKIFFFQYKNKIKFFLTILLMQKNILQWIIRTKVYKFGQENNSSSTIVLRRITVTILV